MKSFYHKNQYNFSSLHSILAEQFINFLLYNTFVSLFEYQSNFNIEVQFVQFITLFLRNTASIAKLNKIMIFLNNGKSMNNGSAYHSLAYFVSLIFAMS